MTVLQQFNIRTFAIVELDTSGGATSYSLPEITPFEQGVLVVDATGNAATNNVTISHPTLNINGVATYLLLANYQSVMFVSDGARVVALAGPQAAWDATTFRVDLGTGAMPTIHTDSAFTGEYFVKFRQVDGHGGTIAVLSESAAGIILERTGATPAINQPLGTFQVGGYDGTKYTNGVAGWIGFTAEAWDNTHNGAYLIGVTQEPGTNRNTSNQVNRVFIRKGAELADASGNEPTGGDKGAGTWNVATAYYINGVNLAGNLPATATNDDAAAGHVGEIQRSEVLSGSAVSLTTATFTNVTSVSLTAGDWDVRGFVGFSPDVTTTIQAILAGIGTASAADPTTNSVLLIAAFTAGRGQRVGVPSRRFSLSGTTTFYLVAYSEFGISTMAAYGWIEARRAR